MGAGILLLVGDLVGGRGTHLVALGGGTHPQRNTEAHHEEVGHGQAGQQHVGRTVQFLGDGDSNDNQTVS